MTSIPVAQDPWNPKKIRQRRGIVGWSSPTKYENIMEIIGQMTIDDPESQLFEQKNVQGTDGMAALGISR